MKPKELRLMLIVFYHGCLPYILWDRLDKQEQYYLSKWTDKGWWEYGVSLGAGWVTRQGFEAMSGVLTELGALGGREQNRRNDRVRTGCPD